MRPPLPPRPAALLALLLLALGAPAAAAPATPAGPVLPVSADPGFFLGPDAAATPAGEVVVVWYGEPGGQTTADIDVYGRRFSPAGAPLGPAFRVNAAAAGQQRRPAVAVGPDGAFVVAWDTNTSAVWARRFAADGTPLTGDIPVSLAADAPRDPDVAVAADGTFAVAWQLTSAAGDDDVAVRRFDLDGTPLGAARVPYDAAEADQQVNPALAALPGGAALVWETVSADATETAVVLQRLDATGAPAGAPLPVAASPAATAELRDPSVAAAPGGAAVVAWATYSEAQPGLAPTLYGIAARSYDAAGAPLGPAVDLVPRAAVERFAPAVAVAADGSAAVAWVDGTQQEGLPAGLALGRLTAAGQPEGELISPRPPTPDQPSVSGVAAAVAPAVDGALWVAWAQSTTGEDVSAIAMRRYVERLFTVNLPLVRR